MRECGAELPQHPKARQEGRQSAGQIFVELKGAYSVLLETCPQPESDELVGAHIWKIRIRIIL